MAAFGFGQPLLLGAPQLGLLFLAAADLLGSTLVGAHCVLAVSVAFGRPRLYPGVGDGSRHCHKRDGDGAGDTHDRHR